MINNNFKKNPPTKKQAQKKIKIQGFFDSWNTCTSHLLSLFTCQLKKKKIDVCFIKTSREFINFWNTVSCLNDGFYSFHYGTVFVDWCVAVQILCAQGQIICNW